MVELKIEFFHDVICSFCFPMSYRMRKLQSEMPDIDIVHRSFALAKNENDFISMFGSREASKNEILEHWHHANQNDDLHRFNIEGMRKADFLFPTSINALLACKAAFFLSGNSGYWDLFDALQDALFVQNLNVESEEVIYSCVRQLNMNFEQWKELYASDKVRDAVNDDLKLSEQYDIQSVPSLIVNEKYLITGAISYEQLKDSIKQIKAKLDPETSKGSSCELKDGKWDCQ